MMKLDLTGRKFGRLMVVSPASNTSGCCNVCFNKTTSKWTAKITTDKGRKHLGTFARKKDAIAARKQAETELNL